MSVSLDCYMVNNNNNTNEYNEKVTVQKYAGSLCHVYFYEWTTREEVYVSVLQMSRNKG